MSGTAPAKVNLDRPMSSTRVLRFLFAFRIAGLVLFLLIACGNARAQDAVRPSLAGEAAAEARRQSIEHIPYKGSGQALTAMLSGEFQISFPQLSTAIPHIKSGKLIALGVTTSRRSALMPELPTVAESGTPGYDTSSWSGLMAPAGIPKQVVKKLSDATNGILKEPSMTEKLFNQGAEVVGGSPEQFAAVISREIAQWKKLVASERIK